MLIPVRIILYPSYPKTSHVIALRSSSVLSEDGIPVVYVLDSTWELAPKRICDYYSSSLTRHLRLDKKNSYNVVNIGTLINAQLYNAAKAGNYEFLRALLEREERLILHEQAVALKGEAKDRLYDRILSIDAVPLIDMVNYANRDGSPKLALHFAVEYGHLDMVRLLLSKGGVLHRECFQINSSSSPSPLTKAFNQSAWRGHTHLIEEVILAGTKRSDEARDRYCEVLTAAITNNQSSLLWILLEMGVNLEQYNYHILHTAAQTKNTKLVEDLLDWDIDVNGECTTDWYIKYTALYNAITINHLPVMHSLINHGASLLSVNRSQTALHCARSADAAIAIMDRGLDVNEQSSYGWTPLYDLFDVGTMRTMIEHGASLQSVESTNQTVLHVHAKRLDHNVAERVRVLVSVDAHVNAVDNYGMTPLLCIVSNNYMEHNSRIRTEAVAELIAAGADVNVRDNKGLSALYYAINKCYKEVVDVLLSAPNLSINDRDHKGQGVWHWFAEMKMRKEKFLQPIATSLLRAGADVNMKDHNGVTALHVAVQRRQDAIPMYCYLLMSEVRVNETDNSDQTALHYAAKAGSVEAVRFLLEHGADKSIVDNFGQDPMHYSRRNQAAVLALLNKT